MNMNSIPKYIKVHKDQNEVLDLKIVSTNQKIKPHQVLMVKCSFFKVRLNPLLLRFINFDWSLNGLD